MRITSLSSSDLARNTGGATKAADEGPVFITDGGRTSHVLLSVAEYRRLGSPVPCMLERLSMPGLGDIPFEVPKAELGLRPAELL